MSAPQQPSALETARAAGRAEAEKLVAERMAAGERRYREQEAARRRLAERYGNDHEKRWIADPHGPTVAATSLMHAFLHKASPDRHQLPEMQQAPELERVDALAAAHMITVARRDAQRLEEAVMRHILEHGVTWDELADALETTAEELRKSVPRHVAPPETWTAGADEPT